jgi:hypothetical protein
MNIKPFFVSLLILSLSLSLTGCDEQKHNGGQIASEEMQRFEGTWTTTQPIQWYIKPSFTFYDNQSFVVGDASGRYRIENNTLILTWNDKYQTVYEYDYTFLDNNTVELTYIPTEDTGTYTRQ